MFDYDISTPAAVAQNTANGSHSAVIGVSMDGYPIYGLWGYDDEMNVVEMKSSYKLKEGETGYNGIDDYVYEPGLGHLDVCNGHFGPTPEFPDGIYHYHSTMMNGEGDMGFPYFLLCYHGETFLETHPSAVVVARFAIVRPMAFVHQTVLTERCVEYAVKTAIESIEWKLYPRQRRNPASNSRRQNENASCPCVVSRNSQKSAGVFNSAKR